MYLVGFVVQHRLRAPPETFEASEGESDPDAKLRSRGRRPVLCASFFDVSSFNQRLSKKPPAEASAAVDGSAAAATSYSAA